MRTTNTVPEETENTNSRSTPDANNGSTQPPADGAETNSPAQPAPLVRQGVLEILPDGWGFLRSNNFDPNSHDIYVAQAQIKRFGLKTGDTVSGVVRPPKDTEKYYGLLRVETVNGLSPDQARNRANYDELVPIYPDTRLILETEPKNMTARVIDLIAPIGKGQRAIVVAPPKAGKTTILKSIASTTPPSWSLRCVLRAEGGYRLLAEGAAEARAGSLLGMRDVCRCPRPSVHLAIVCVSGRLLGCWTAYRE